MGTLNKRTVDIIYINCIHTVASVWFTHAYLTETLISLVNASSIELAQARGPAELPVITYSS